MRQWIICLLVFVIIGCGPAITPTPILPTADLRATETRIAANIFATQTAAAPTVTRPFTPTNSPVPSAIFTPTRTPIRATPKPTVIPTPKATVAPVLQDQMIVLMNKWQVTLISTRRDKTIYGYFDSETAFGTWATLMFRVKNLQGGSDYIAKSFGAWFAADGKRVPYETLNTIEDKAQYYYSCCDSAYTMLSPGQETVILYCFDVPENTQSLVFNFTLSGIPIVPMFAVPNFSQIPARKK